MEDSVEKQRPPTNNNLHQKREKPQTLQCTSFVSSRPKDIVHKCVSDPGNSCARQAESQRRVRDINRAVQDWEVDVGDGGGAGSPATVDSWTEDISIQTDSSDIDCGGSVGGGGGNGGDSSIGSENIGFDGQVSCTGSTMNSPGQSSMCPKGLFARSLRYPSSSGTTRKCVLTLDGYSYVIVASTPENRTGREDTITSLSDRRSSGGVDRSKSNSPTGSQHPQSAPPVNGQVSKQGSLTIVRRSNSRKGNLGFQGDPQQQYQLQSPSQTTTPSAAAVDSNSICATPSDYSSAAATPNRDCNSSSFGQSLPTPSNLSSYLDTSENQLELSDPHHQQQDQQQQQSLIHLQQYSRMQTLQQQQQQSTNSTTTTTTTAAISGNMSPTMGSGGVMSPVTVGSDNGGGNASDSVDLATEHLPAVDTPDACDKAAVRLRCLLRLLQAGEISAEILQKNLHYAARVLEAVFIDETKSPSILITREKPLSGQNSVESKDPDGTPVQKNRLLPVSPSANNSCCSPNNDNNSNVNLSSNLSEDNQQQQQHAANCNQTSIESRTKGVSLAPQTHSGPTGPPLSQIDEHPSNDTNTASSTTAGGSSTATPPTTSTATTTSGSNSLSNKATVQRQRRLRTPVWARSMTSEKTY